MKKFDQLNEQIIACRKCPRLVAWREQVAKEKRKAYRDQEYWGKPVPGFGDRGAQIVVVGLAPGAHGSNRTGRQFTGDGSGSFLYPALYRAGFASQPESIDRADNLILRDLYLTASGRCAPPDNKPLPEELDNCQPFLERELEWLHPKVIVCLGQIAFDRIKRIYLARQTTNGKRQTMKFSHGAVFHLTPDAGAPDIYILCSYHPSQQNTLTGKLTAKMFDDIWAKAKDLASET
jgi:uracil-DNA glycosylase family 4